MFDPDTARFLTPDPIGFDAGDPNLYRYCANDPVNRIDPSGHDDKPWYEEVGDFFVDTANDVIDVLPSGEDVARGAIRIALRVAGIDRQAFDAFVNACGGLDVLSYFNFGFSNIPDPSLDAALGGFQDAFNHLSTNFVPTMKTALAKWLGLAPEWLGLAENPDPEKLIPTILRQVGYTWERMVSKIGQETGADMTTLLWLINYISSDLSKPDDGLPDSVTQWIQKWCRPDPDFASAIRDALKPVIQKIQDELVGAIIDKVVTGLFKKAAAGPAAAIVALGQFLQGAAQNAAGLCEIVKHILGVIRDWLSGARRESIKMKLIEGAEAALPVFFGIAAHQAGLSKPDEVVRKAFAKVEELAQRPVNIVIGTAGKFVRGIFNSVLRTLGLAGPGITTPLTVPADRPSPTGGRAKLWTAGGTTASGIVHRGRLMLSPEKEVADTLRGNEPCPVKIRSAGGEWPPYLAQVENLTGLLAKKGALTPKDGRDFPGVNGTVVQNQDRLLEAILKCSPCESGQCFVAGTPCRLARGGAARIEEVGLGERVLTHLPGEWGHALVGSTPGTDPDPRTHREVLLVREDEVGHRVEVGLIRSTGWLAGRGVGRVGDRTTLDLPEMGVAGEFQVVEILPCPPIEPGPGRVVTGVFRHRRGRVYDVQVAGEADPLGMTASHPVWSATRRRWVSVGEWVVGERVQVVGGTRAVLRIAERGEEPVYNLEVDADHCYRVGEQGILVHNSSPGTPGATPPATQASPTSMNKAECECGAAERLPFTIKRGDRTYTGSADMLFPSDKRTKQIPICRVHQIDGPIEIVPKTKQDILDSDSTRSRVNTLIVHNSPFQGTNTFEVGHLIADSLGGPNTAENMIPMHNKLNNEKDKRTGTGAPWKLMENWIGRCLGNSTISCPTDTVTEGHMHVDVTYNTNAPGVEKYIPTKLKVKLLFATLNKAKTASHEFSFDNYPVPTTGWTPPKTCI